MSYTTVKAIWPGDKSEDFREFRNSWGSAPVVWNLLAERYLGKPNYAYLSSNMQPLWDLWMDDRVPQADRAVHMLTFDRMYVLKKDYGRMARDIRTFLGHHRIPAGANHWPALAELFESNPEVPAIGLHCTSVSVDPFKGPYDEEREDYDALDWDTAYDLYAEMTGVDTAPAPVSADDTQPEAKS